MIKFIEMSQLKEQLSVISIEIKQSPKTQKLFAVTYQGDKELCLKVQQDIDFAKPVKFLYDDTKGLLDGCIVNVSSSAPPLASF